MSHEDERSFLRTNQVLVALVGVLVGLVGFFLSNLHTEVQSTIAGAQKTSQALALLTQIAQEDHRSLGSIDERLRLTEQDMKVLQRIVLDMEKKRER